MKILLSILGICYVLSPYDVIPDFFVGLGWLDDVIVLGLLWKFLYAPIKRQYHYANTEHKQRQSFQSNVRGRFSGNAHDFGSRTVNNGKTKDPWTQLGIKRGSTTEEIKKAYRRLTFQYHPDRVVHLGEEFKVLAENRFKDIQEGYRELMPK